MKRFFKNILIFILPPVVILIAWIIYYLHEYSQVRAKVISISEYQTIIMGDSQMQRIDPDLFSPVAFNFASSGEHFYFTYNKLKNITEVPDYKTKRVILGVNVHSFSPAYTRFITPEFPEGASSIRRYLYFLSWKELITNSGFFNLSQFRNIFCARTDWGGFRGSQNENPDITVVNQTFSYHFCSNNPELCLSQELYLHKIAELCYSRNIDLILVSTPYHPDYLNKVDKFYFNALNKELNGLHYSLYFNFLWDRVSTSWMSDAAHLNNRGLKVYSQMLGDTLISISRTN